MRETKCGLKPADTYRNDRGIGLMVALMIMSAVILAIGLMAPAVYEVVAAGRTTKIRSDLNILKTAIVGNPELAIAGSRSDFGYVGNMGNAPPDLSSLWIRGTQQPAYVFDPVKKVGAGWAGPYVPNAILEELLAQDTDRFGNPYIFTTTPFTRPSDGQTVDVRIQSTGPDGIKDTDDDMWTDILHSETTATVTGSLLRGNNPVKFATMTLNIPDHGGFSQQYTTTDADGIFTLLNVTYGFRSLSVDPRLSFEDGSVHYADGNSTINFTIINAGTNDITLTSMKVLFDAPSNTLTPTATPLSSAPYFSAAQIAGQTVFDMAKAYAGDKRWRADGTSLPFRDQNGNAISILIKGSHKVSRVVPIRVDRTYVVTPNVYVRGLGQSVNVKITKFNTAQTGGGSSVVVIGHILQLDFSDGSSMTFLAP